MYRSIVPVRRRGHPRSGVVAARGRCHPDGMAVARPPVSTATVQRGALLRAALKRMCRATGLPVTFGGMVSSGGRSMPLTEFVGIRTDALSGLVIGAGNGLGG